MLPPWREQVRIFLHPQQVVLLRLSRGLKKRVLRKQILPCVESVGATANEPLWTGVVAVLKRAINDSLWQGAQVEIVLSNHFVHYALVPWSEPSKYLSTARERQAHLRHRFNLAYGEAAKRWDLRMSEAGVDKPALASGVDIALLDAIRAIFDQAGMRIPAIHPHLMVTLNQARNSMQQGPAWFAMMEQGRLCLALLDNGLFKTVKSFLLENDWHAQLEVLLTREAMLSGDEQLDWPVMLYWPELAMSTVPVLTGRKITRLSGKVLDGLMNRDDAAFRLAMWA